MTEIRAVTLDNGLQVIVKEAHTAPIISTWLWYRVGSRNEAEGQTGMSHWVEHMMFKGSAHYAKGAIMREVGRYGGYANAMTSHDFTAYYETLPSERADLALQVESDRMTAALFDPAEVAAERSVVISEREASENEPRSVLAEEMSAMAFRVHPYHHQTIGWKIDLERLTRDELYDHYCSYYRPSNAVLVAVGDVNTDDYLSRVERYFGGIPAGEADGLQIRPEPEWSGERRVTLRMPGSAPAVRFAYRTPPVAHGDYIPLVVLDAVLSGGKAMFAFGGSPARSARLYRALVETEIASSVGSNYHPSLDPYLFAINATVREGRDADAVEEALLAEITRLHNEPVREDELAVAIRQTQAQFAYSSESVTNQGLTLGFLEMLDSHTRMDGLLDELAAVTPEDVARVARAYLVEQNRIVGRYIPTEPNGQGTTNEDQVARYWRGCVPEVAFLGGATGAQIGPDTIMREQLENGAVVLILENHASASVSIEGRMLAGSMHDGRDREGLASLAASMLRRGTGSHSYQELNRLLDNVGASCGFTAGRNAMSFGGQSLAGDADLLIALLAEILGDPIFPERELETLRGQLLTRLGYLETDTGYRADRALMAMLYSDEHPYSRSSLGQRDVIQALSREDLVTFYDTYYAPSGLLISVVGDVDADHVLATLQAAIGSWRTGFAGVDSDIPDAQTPNTVVSERVEIPGKSQVDLAWGVVGMRRSSPDYYPARIANLILGRLGLMGRLGARVRDEAGLAYYVSSHVAASPGPYPWTIEAGVNPKDIDQSVALVLEEVRRLREEPVGDAELADSRTLLTGSLPLHLETNEGIAGLLLTLEMYDLGLDYLARYRDTVYGVTKEDIQAVANKYLTLDRYALAMAGTFG